MAMLAIFALKRGSPTGEDEATGTAELAALAGSESEAVGSAELTARPGGSEGRPQPCAMAATAARPTGRRIHRQEAKMRRR